jgi:hypothetical protein
VAVYRILSGGGREAHAHKRRNIIRNSRVCIIRENFFFYFSADFDPNGRKWDLKKILIIYKREIELREAEENGETCAPQSMVGVER